jgi:ribosome biogenesis protein ENP2
LQQQAAAAPVDYKALREQMKKRKIEEQQKSRITVSSLTCFICIISFKPYPDERQIFLFFPQRVVRIPKVNRQIFDSIIEDEMNADTENADKSSKKKKDRRLKVNKDLLEDVRFKDMFENKVGSLLLLLTVMYANFSL